MTKCANCQAPDGERIFRNKDGLTWTQDWSKLSDWTPTHKTEWESEATMIRLNLTSGYCDKCEYQRTHSKEKV